MSDADLSCSFCGKTKNDVSRLIAGPKAFICNECVDLCSSIVHPDRAGIPNDPPGSEAIRLRCVEIVAGNMGKTTQWPLVVACAREVADFVFHGIGWRATKASPAPSAEPSSEDDAQ